MAITSSLVLLMSLNDPTQAFEIACYRTLDVAVGVSCAMVTANVLQDWHAEPPPTAPGWRHLLGAQWPSVLHGLRAAISVVTVLIVWVMVDLPDVGEDGGHDRRRDGRAADCRRRHHGAPSRGGEVVPPVHGLPAGRHRGTGLPRATGRDRSSGWLAMIGGVVWVGMHIQMGRHGIYVGTQFVFVFVVTMVQGFTPPESILPGVDRFAGITGGLGILMIVSLLLWPSDEEMKAGT